MRSERVVRSIALLPLIVVLVALLLVGRTHHPGSADDVMARYVASGKFIDRDNQLIWNIALSILDRTRFESKLIINGPIRSDAINFYVVDAHSDRYTSLNCNCAAYVKKHAIICDQRFLDYFEHLLQDPDPHRGRLAIERSAVRDPQNDMAFLYEGKVYPLTQMDSLEQGIGPEGLNKMVDFIYQRFSYALLQWIIGHEIGHVVLGHETGAAAEAAADQFVISNLRDPQDAFYMWIMLGSVIDTLQGKLVEEQYPHRGPALELDPRLRPRVTLRDDRGSGHPPLLLRAIAMNKRLISSGTITDETGFVDAVRDRIRLVSKGPPPAFDLCHAGSAPRLDLAIAGVGKGNSLEEQVASYMEDGRQDVTLAQHAASVEDFTQAIDLILGSEQGQQGLTSVLVQALMARGASRALLGNWQLGLADWTSVIRLDPSNSYAHSNAGLALYELQDTAAAVTHFRRAIELDSLHNDEAWAGLAIALEAQQSADEAVKAYRHALKLEPEYSSMEWLRYELGWTTKQRCAAARLLQMMPEETVHRPPVDSTKGRLYEHEVGRK